MALQNFNVFGMIMFVEQEMTISGTVIFNNGKQVERKRQYQILFSRKNSDAVVAFSARVEKKEISLALSRKAFFFNGIDTEEEFFLQIADIEKELHDFISVIDKATFNSEADETYIDKAIELAELGMSEEAIEKELSKTLNTKMASIEATEQELRQPSKLVDLYALSQAIMIYTKEGNVIVDLDRAHEIAENLPILIKKASKGIIDQATKTWLLKTFNKKK